MAVAGHASEQGALVIQVAKTTMDPKCSTILIRIVSEAFHHSIYSLYMKE